MDCDMILLQNMDELMTLPLPSRDHIAAAHACTCNPRRIKSYPDDWLVPIEDGWCQLLRKSRGMLILPPERSSTTSLAFRIPENCAYTSVSHPQALTNPTPAANIDPLQTSSSPTPRGHALLNSGLVILHPSKSTSSLITQYIQTDPHVKGFKFPDQDALAVIFKGKWTSLPWCYNALKTLRKVHPGVWRDDEVRCLHYM